MANIPIELITDILSRQPVKSLLRFRCVSKPWCSIIDGPDFIKLHLSLSTQSYSGFILVSKNYHFLNLGSRKPVLLDNPLESQFHRTVMSGVCEGLVCLSNNENGVAIWNPATRKHRVLPVSPVDLPDYEFLVYGFGYDLVNDDYKVLRVAQTDDVDVKSKVMVYSLKSDSWKRVGNFPYTLCYRREMGCYVSGALHYVTMSPKIPEFTLIVAYDLASETYRLIPHPEPVKNNQHMLVAVLDRSLCALCNVPQTGFSIWVMKEYGMRKSWTKLIYISSKVIPFWYAYVKPLVHSEKRDAVLLEQQLPEGSMKLIWYDLKKKKITDSKYCGLPVRYEAMYFVESLVSLKRDIATSNSKMAEPEKGQKKRDDFLSKGFKLVL